MADSVELVVELKDQVSKNAKAAARALEALARKSKALDKATQVARNKADRAAASAQRKYDRGVASGMKVAAVGLLAGAAAAGLTAKALYDAATDASGLAYAFDRLTDGKGPETLMRVTKLAANLGLEVSETAHNYADLLKLQFSPAQAEEWVKFGADMQAVGGTAESVSGILRAVGQIKGKGKLMAEELTGQLAEHGVSTTLVKDAVARMMGIDRKNVDAAIRAGKVNAEVGIAAIQEAINKKLHQAKAGDSAVAFVKNTFVGDQKRLAGEAERIGLGLGAIFSRGFEDQVKRAASPANFLSTDPAETEAGAGGFLDKLSNDPIITKMGATVERLGASFATLLPAILEVTLALAEGFGAGFDAEDTLYDAKTFAKMLREEVVPAAKTVGKILGYLTSFVIAVGTAFAETTSGVINDVAFIVEAVMSVPENLSSIGGFLYDAGKQAITGFVNGIVDTWASLKESATAFGANMVTRIESTLGIHSPSREFAHLGRMSAEGFQMGLDKTTPTLPGASAMIGSDTMKGGGSSFGNFSFAITVNGGGDAEETGRAVFAEFESNMTRFLGGMVQQAGA